jgi:HEAT repeat protein
MVGGADGLGHDHGVPRQTVRRLPGVRAVRWWPAALAAILVAALPWSDGEAQGPGALAGPQGRSIEEWRHDLQVGTPMLRERAVVALCQVADPPVGLLIDAIADQDFNVRTMAVFCLGRLGPKGREAVPALVSTLQDRDWIVRRYAAGSLGILEAVAADAAPALARTAVEDSNAEVRQTATFALGRLGRAARETTRPVLQQISEAGPDEATRARATELLRSLEGR